MGCTRKGILLAAGRNTRLYPATLAIPKSLLQVYDKPLIYYPLSTLMLAGVRDILVITAPQTRAAHTNLLGDGSALGVQITYAVQEQASGISDALLIAKDFLVTAPSLLVLADNVFWGASLAATLQQGMQSAGVTILCRAVPDPQRFGIASVDAHGNVLSLEEKPSTSVSNLAVTGCYFLEATASEYVAALKPSARGELEIIDLLDAYLQQDKLQSLTLSDDIFWMDAGTPDSLTDVAVAVRDRQHQHLSAVGCPEQIALAHGWIDTQQLLVQADRLGSGAYAASLRELAQASS